jgi:hypothetical protein
MRSNIINRVKEAGKSLPSYYKLRDKGYSEEEAFEKAREVGSYNIYVEIEGVQYSLKEAMKVVNCEVDYTTVIKRMKTGGMSAYQAITKPKTTYK